MYQLVLQTFWATISHGRVFHGHWALVHYASAFDNMIHAWQAKKVSTRIRYMHSSVIHAISGVYHTHHFIYATEGNH